MNENEVSKVIVDCAVEVHKALGGPGLLESVYEEAMAFEIMERGLTVERQLSVPIDYKGKLLGTPLRLDMKVAGCVLVENKTTTEYNSIYEVQMLTYLRLTKLKLGLVINLANAMSATASTVSSTDSDHRPPSRQANRKVSTNLFLSASLRLCAFALNFPIAKQRARLVTGAPGAVNTRLCRAR